jgi:hypothetical protein
MRSIQSFILIGIGMGCSTSAWAWRNIVCKNGTLERKIEVLFAQEGQKVPCQVKYHREGPTGAPTEQILFSAQARIGFCEEKATEFAGQLAQKGWTCSQTENP